MSELAAAVTRSAAVAEYLASEIEQMAEGQRIGTKKELCARLGVANATLTEAVRLLQERGLVRSRPGPKGGLFVASPDPFRWLGQNLGDVGNAADFLDGAVEVRRSLEELVVLDAAKSCTPADVDEMRDQASKVEEAAARADDDHDPFAREVAQLHQLIARCGSNKILQTVYSGVLAYVDSAATTAEAGQTLASPLPQAAALRELVEAVVAQDEAACRAALGRVHDAGAL